jgi:ribosomal protein S18 acetylase RimI-like enzyme
MEVSIRNATIEDLECCFDIESQSYGLEGATKDRIKKRIEQYPTGFHVLTLNDVIVGFINSGCTNKRDLADEKIKSLIGHDPNGKYLVIFSLVVHPEYRGKRYSFQLLNQMISFANSENKEILLICKMKLIPFYEKFDFKIISKSNSEHGGIEWYEMSYSSSL